MIKRLRPCCIARLISRPATHPLVVRLSTLLGTQATILLEYHIEGLRAHRHYTRSTFGQLGAIRLLLEARADLHSRSTTNETPLHYAAMQDQLAAARLLLDSRATVDAVSSTNSTALHTAASKGYADLVTLLLDYGADQSIRDVCRALSISLES